jgi:signal transduction histidine kinase
VRADRVDALRCDRRRAPPRWLAVSSAGSAARSRAPWRSRAPGGVRDERGAEGGAKGEPIHVRIRACGDLACAEIENRGPPIPAHTLGSLFEPFRQGAGSKGLGLGLYIARAIVVAHGGMIEATSNEGVTMFRVLLPHGAEKEPGTP